MKDVNDICTVTDKNLQACRFCIFMDNISSLGKKFQ
jgi:hypothetical protein